MLLSGRGAKGWSVRTAFLATLCLFISLLFSERARAVTYEPVPAFCEPQQVRDFLAPLERMPKLHQPSANGQIGFGPESLRLRSASSLLVGEGEVGVTLSLAQRSRLRLPWTVTATLVEVNGNGRPIGKPRRLIRRVGWLKPFNGDSLRFEVSDDPAFYREMVALHGASGQKLGRFGFYYRAMPAIGRARLRLNASSYRPESTVFGRVENFGTLSAYYGVPYSIERLEGQGWVEAPESPDGPWILPLLVSGPGLSGKCNGFWIPPTMPPGRYRMVKRVGIGEWLPRKRGTARVLTAEFDVVP